MNLSLTLLIVCISLIVSGCTSSDMGGRAPLAVIGSFDQQAKVSTSRHGLVEVLVTNLTSDLFELAGQHFSEPQLSIQISSNGRPLAEHRFGSSYGIFRLEVIDLDDDDDPEFVLISGHGQGTSVRAEWLEVFEIHDGVFRQLLRTPYSGFFGSGARWTYQHDYHDLGRGHGVALVFHLEHSRLGEGIAEHPESIPGIGMKSFEFAHNKN